MTSAKTDKLKRDRLTRLARLMVDSGLPQSLLDGIIEQSGRLTSLEVELLIDALAREQEEWQIFKSELERIKKQMAAEQKKLAARRKKAADDFVRAALAAQEKKVQAKIKKTLE